MLSLENQQERAWKVVLRTEITKQVNVLRVRGPFHVFNASFDFMETHSLVSKGKILQGAFFIGFDLANLILKAIVTTSKNRAMSRSVYWPCRIKKSNLIARACSKMQLKRVFRAPDALSGYTFNVPLNQHSLVRLKPGILRNHSSAIGGRRIVLLTHVDRKYLAGRLKIRRQWHKEILHTKQPSSPTYSNHDPFGRQSD